MVSLLHRITLRQLEVFSVAARQLSFARTAETLHVTQPAVSMQIRQLEDAVGLVLFERVGRRVALTEAGETLLHHASRTLGEILDAGQALHALRGLAGGTITVALVSTAQYFAPRMLALFVQRHKALDVRMVVGNREVLMKLLVDNEVDLAIMGRAPDALDAISEPVAANPYVLIGPPDHPLAGARQFDLHELRGEAFLIREGGSGTRTVAEEMFRTHLFEPARTITLGSNEAIKQVVMAGLGVSLVSRHTLALELLAGRIAILDAMGTPVARTWYVVHRRRKALSPAARAFRQFVLEEARALLATDGPAR